jgi:hypothetical protein
MFTAQTTRIDALYMNRIIATIAVTAALAGSSVHAQWTFEANLTGASENPPNASPATGFGIVVLNAAQNQITVDESWSGLLAAATASHIHGPAGAGTNAGVLFPLSGVPAATSGAIPQQTFAITSTQVGYLFSGLLYMNVHDSIYPGGEIRGQLLLVPEPGTLALLGTGLAAVGWRFRGKLARPGTRRSARRGS